MSCGEDPSALNAGGASAPRIVKLHYRGQSSVQIQGPVTGQLHEFSKWHPIQIVDLRDATLMMQTRMFTQVPCR
jgi:hypothetical protein